MKKTLLTTMLVGTLLIVPISAFAEEIAGDEIEYETELEDELVEGYNPLDYFPNPKQINVGDSRTSFGTIIEPSIAGLRTLKSGTEGVWSFTTKESGDYHIVFIPIGQNDCAINTYVNSLSIKAADGDEPIVEMASDTYSKDFDCWLEGNKTYYFSARNMGKNFKMLLTKTVAGTTPQTAPTVNLDECTLVTKNDNLLFPNVDHTYSIANGLGMRGQFSYVILKPQTTGIYEYALDENFLGGSVADIVEWDGTGNIDWISRNSTTQMVSKAVRIYLSKDKQYILRYTNPGRYGTVLSLGLVEIPGNNQNTGTNTNANTNTNTNQTTVSVTERFSDVLNGKWYVPAVQYVYDNGIMSGISGTTKFKPDASCTREMMVTILYRSFGSPSVSGLGNPFGDVPNDKWYTDAIVWAYHNGVTTGTVNPDVAGWGNGKFGLGQNVTREQLATFLLRFGQKKGFDCSGRNENIGSYVDAGQISGFAVDAMKWANYYKVINGKSKQGTYYLAPKANATRAEVAQMIMNFQNTFGK